MAKNSPTCSTANTSMRSTANSARQVARQSDISVSVCGKQIHVSQDGARESLQALQGMVRQAVDMEAHCFVFFDVDGRELYTDSEVANAIDQGKTPLKASVADRAIHAVHDFEHRREELAQMQWKVVRDQLANLASSMQGLTQETQELRHRLNQSQLDNNQSVEQLKFECGQQAIQLSKRVDDCVNTDALMKFTEEVHSVADLLHEERACRLSALRGVDNNIERLHEVVANERQLREREISVGQQRLEEDKIALEVALDVERRSRAAQVKDIFTEIEELHGKHSSLDNKLSYETEARIAMCSAEQEVTSKMMKQLQDDLMEQAKVNSKQAKAESNQFSCELSSRLVLVEDSLASIEETNSQMASRFASGQDRLLGQCTKLGQAMEQGRLETRALRTISSTQGQKSESIENDIREVDINLRECIEKEKKVQQEALQSIVKKLQTQSKNNVLELQTQMRELMQMEVESRSQAICQVLDDVGYVVEKEMPSSALSKSSKSSNGVKYSGKLANDSMPKVYEEKASTMTNGNVNPAIQIQYTPQRSPTSAYNTQHTGARLRAQLPSQSSTPPMPMSMVRSVSANGLGSRSYVP